MEFAFWYFRIQEHYHSGWVKQTTIFQSLVITIISSSRVYPEILKLARPNDLFRAKPLSQCLTNAQARCWHYVLCHQIGAFEVDTGKSFQQVVLYDFKNILRNISTLEFTVFGGAFQLSIILLKNGPSRRKTGLIFCLLLTRELMRSRRMDMRRCVLRLKIRIRWGLNMRSGGGWTWVGQLWILACWCWCQVETEWWLVYGLVCI